MERQQKGQPGDLRPDALIRSHVEEICTSHEEAFQEGVKVEGFQTHMFTVRPCLHLISRSNFEASDQKWTTLNRGVIRV